MRGRSAFEVCSYAVLSAAALCAEAAAADRSLRFLVEKGQVEFVAVGWPSALQIKGAGDGVRKFFLSNMSSRAAKMLVDDMQAMGPVRLRDVDEAQVLLVNLAKDLAAKGEIVIAKQRGDEELVY